MIWALPISLATTFGIDCFLSFPPGNEMFQFPGFPLHYYWFIMQYRNITYGEFPHSDIRGYNRSFAAHRGFSQLVTSFFGAMYQGILLYALCSLIFLSSLIALSQSVEFTFSTFPWLLYSTTFFVIRSYVYFLRINLSFISIVYLLSCLNVLFL